MHTKRREERSYLFLCASTEISNVTFCTDKYITAKEEKMSLMGCFLSFKWKEGGRKGCRIY